MTSLKVKDVNEFLQLIKQDEVFAGFGSNPDFFSRGAVDKEENYYMHAAKWLEIAAEQGHAVAQIRLGDCYANGVGIDDYMQAINWYEKAAEQGNISAQFKLGEIYYDQGGEEYIEQAIKWFKKAAEQGDDQAQHRLGRLYYVQKKYPQAFEWLEKSAEQGNPDAPDDLWTFSYERKEYSNAVKWLKKYVNSDHILTETTSLLMLGVCYYLGLGTEQDFTQAVNCFKENADAGDESALVMLAICCYRGTGTKKSLKQAIEYGERAAAQGNALGQVLTAYLYNCQNNKEKSLHWLIEAVESFFKREVDLLKYRKKQSKSFSPLDDCIDDYLTIGSVFFDELLSFLENEENSAAKVILAFFYQHKGEKRKTLKYLNEAVEKNDLIASFKLGKYYDYLGNIDNIRYFDNAKEYFKKVLPNEDDYIPIWTILAKYQKSQTKYSNFIKYIVAVLAKENLSNIEHQRELEEKNKELNNLIAMFAHNFLGTLQCIRSNAEHDNNVSIHLKTVKMMSGALTAFSIISADDDKLIEQLKQDNSGETTLLQNLANNLALAVSQLLSKTNKDKIINLYLNYLRKTNQIETEISGEELRNDKDYRKKWQALQHQWEDEFNALFSEKVEISHLQTWLETNFFPVEITGFNDYNIRFKEYGITDSIFLVVFMEILVNALKYMDVGKNKPLTITLCKENQTYQLTCENPSAQESYRGTHKGMDFLKSLARKVNGQFITESTEQSFKSTFIILAELLE